MNILGIGIFAVTYVMISARRLSWLGFDRPAGALLGALCCVAFGVLSPNDAISAVNGPTILLLLGVMGMGAFLAVDGFFDEIQNSVVRLARTPSGLLGTIVWGSGLLSAFITNDAVCVLGAPLVVRLIKRNGLPALPFLLALATAANTGSVATLVGNPQNMLCATLGGLSYRHHLLFMGPLAIICLAINHALLWLIYHKQLAACELVFCENHAPLNRRTAATMSVIAGTVIVFSAGADLAWTATGGFVALMLIHRRDTRVLWNRIDWSLLLFFASLFIVVEGFIRSGGSDWLFDKIPLAHLDFGQAGGLFMAAGIFLAGSNIVSNVPFILVVRDQMAAFPNPAVGWELLAMASTFAGNLTLLGSVANVIVAENARELGGMGFLDHIKVGLPLTLLTTATGVLWFLAFART